ncbi:hypothetical protein [Conexibacter arvalis]|uniref:Uncharacterized protein n=1 Tax=Conexibacter arvalis TaxID=912552 RepID=A0A840ICG6_9ACTN|nr:hypothetical protein [Conexibacter arvalis]MBB4662526.1 hypothetical protein [Conexibacter arvalis]
MQVASEQEQVDEGEERVASLVERGLFASALEFYGAAGAAIDCGGSEKPALRLDLDALQAVRAAMGALERRIAIAWGAGLSYERIASITRLELELVELIVRRQRAEPAR